ncbi:phenylacetate-CoA ligase [Parafrankia irregularis]|uniref:Phenylacetate-CoA ligase n=1 Tax=Parafrankia irregularis TaxID=795642 RepID=A0A0S4QE48_9ACTN|nr:MULTISPECIES: phenylacetate--CoA ligase family protein [Parafrankia]MBE3199555.1 phenylacetate--CoA ligase family protein [Parafrankia sp. CH37]CUU53780.1 phenylacetate-CoA ligase [Parafrankia irregularis]
MKGPAIGHSRVVAAAFRAACESPLVTTHLNTLARLELAEPSEVARWQERRLRRFVNRWATTVPYYLEHPEYLRSTTETAAVLDKETVRRASAAFVNSRVPARHVTTGGTGGRPLSLRISYSSFFSEWAHIAYVWSRAGISLGDPKITFRGSSLGTGFDGRPMMYQRTYNHVAVSPFHLSDRTFTELLTKIRDLRPVAIWGYPSSITPFALWVARTGPHPELARLRAVLLASEAALGWQLSLFREVFGAPPIRWYGQSEKVVFGAECPRLPGHYHVTPTYGVAQVVNNRITGSGMTNTAMPLLRYDTEDGGVLKQPGPVGSRCACGSPFAVLHDVAGRWDQSLVYGIDDEPISSAALNFHDEAFARFDRFQFRQDRRGEVELRVSTVGRVPEAAELEKARSLLQHRVGDRLVISVAIANADELLSRRGKILMIDQRYRPDEATFSAMPTQPG